MTIYPDVPPRPVLQIAMPRAPRIYATGTAISSSPDSRLDCRDARWTTQRAVGSREFLSRYLPLRGRRRMIPLPQQIRGLGIKKVSGTFFYDFAELLARAEVPR
jgi:hypothetical protein